MALAVVRSCVMSRITIAVSRQLRVLESKQTCRELHAQCSFGAEFLMKNASKIRDLSCLPSRNLSVRTIFNWSYPQTIFNSFNPPVVEEFKLGSHIISLEVGYDESNKTCILCHMNGTTVESKIVVSHVNHKDHKVLEVCYDEPTYDESGGPHDPEYREILCAQLIERSIRPLFSEGFSAKIVVFAGVLKSNARHDAGLMAIIATSAALMISNDTRAGPIGAIRIGRINETIIINPTIAEQRKSDINLLYVCTREKTVMVDLEACEISESDLESNLKLAHLEAAKCIDSLLRLRDRYGKNHKSDVLKEISKNMQDTRSQSSNARSRKLEKKKSMIVKNRAHITKLKSKGYLFDGRCIHQIRPVQYEVGYLPWEHGSSHLSCAVTKVSCTATLGKPDQALRAFLPPRKRFRIDYESDPFGIENIIIDYDLHTIWEIARDAAVRHDMFRHEVGLRAFVAKALLAVIPYQRDFPYLICLELDTYGSPWPSSPTTGVCGGSMALMDAGVPVQCHVAGVSIGLVTISETSNGQLENYHIITDIAGLEDDLVEMDCKVAGTRNGITAIQLGVKSTRISLDIICEALSYGRQARLQILDHMEQVLKSPKITSSVLENPRGKVPLLSSVMEVGELYECIVKSISEGCAVVEYNDGCGGLLYARELSYEEVPKVSNVLFIGQHIILKCIKINSEGYVEFSLKALEKAPKKINSSVAEVGELYECIVKSILEGCAVVEYNGDRYGSICTCELSNEKVSKVSDVLCIGQHIILKCIRKSSEGFIEFSLKAVA